MKDPDALLTVRQVAIRLGTSTAQVQRLIGEMRPVNIGCGKRNNWRVRESALNEWIDLRTKQPEYGKIEIVRVARKTAKRPYPTEGLLQPRKPDKTRWIK